LITSWDLSRYGQLVRIAKIIGAPKIRDKILYKYSIEDFDDLHLPDWPARRASATLPQETSEAVKSFVDTCLCWNWFDRPDALHLDTVTHIMVQWPKGPNGPEGPKGPNGP
jgi:hypothetical protein